MTTIPRRELGWGADPMMHRGKKGSGSSEVLQGWRVVLLLTRFPGSASFLQQGMAVSAQPIQG